MLHKMRESDGLTVVEMLCAVAILSLLVLMLGTGMNMAQDVYRRMMLHSETKLLMSTLSSAITDELRYASDVNTVSESDETLLNYTSRLYREGTNLDVYYGTDTDTLKRGQIYAQTGTGDQYYLLPDGVYGKDTWVYGVRPKSMADASNGPGLVISFDKTKRVFTVNLTIEEMKTDRSAFVDSGTKITQKFSVRCLN